MMMKLKILICEPILIISPFILCITFFFYRFSASPLLSVSGLRHNIHHSFVFLATPEKEGGGCICFGLQIYAAKILTRKEKNNAAVISFSVWENILLGKE
jgi:hypothetical protein